MSIYKRESDVRLFVADYVKIKVSSLHRLSLSAVQLRGNQMTKPFTQQSHSNSPLSPHFVLLLCVISGLLQAISVSKSVFNLPGVLDLNFRFFAHFCPLFLPIFGEFLQLMPKILS